MNFIFLNKKNKNIIFAVIGLSLLISSCDITNNSHTGTRHELVLNSPLVNRGNTPADHVIEISTPSYKDIRALYESADTDIDHVLAAKHTPPAFLPKQVPGDFAEIKETEERKKTFLSFVLLPIQAVNATLLEERRHLIALQAKTKGTTPYPQDVQDKLDALAQRYGGEATFKNLLMRIDEIPASLALAQAALESGWGTSRFAAQGNALFGEHTTSLEHGLQPEGLEPEHSVKVEAFDTVYDSVASYMLNLNTHAAYQGFRAMRAKMRKNNQPLNGRKLAQGLLSYSERQHAYIEELHLVIDHNKLTRLDQPLVIQNAKLKN